MTFEDFDRIIAERKAEYFRKNRFAEYAPGAGIDWLTTEEREQHHALKMSLPTMSEEREAAKARIAERIAARKKSA